MGLEPDASPETIKKQYFAMSKTHHPDHNPNDPSASKRFVDISEAYAILGNPDNREKYDRELKLNCGISSLNMHQRSHSSSRPSHGSRPASGLSRRRTQFKGPPPSFYKNGGWGAYASRRSSQAEGSAPGSKGSQAGNAHGGGFSPGQGQVGFDRDVPHFDHDAHYRTQEQQDFRRRQRLRTDITDTTDNSSMLFKFVLVSSVVTFAISIPFWDDEVINVAPKPRAKT